MFLTNIYIFALNPQLSLPQIPSSTNLITFYNCFLSMGLKRINPEQRLGWKMKRISHHKHWILQFFFPCSTNCPYSIALTISRLKFIGLLHVEGGDHDISNRPILWMICTLRNCSKTPRNNTDTSLKTLIHVSAFLNDYNIYIYIYIYIC